MNQKIGLIKTTNVRLHTDTQRNTHSIDMQTMFFPVLTQCVALKAASCLCGHHVLSPVALIWEPVL